MGMFDHLFIKMQLPLTKTDLKNFSKTDWENIDFQTKDFDNTMSTYILKKNGSLYYEKIDGNLVRIMTEKEEKKIKKQGKWCWPYNYEVKSRKSIFYKYTGDVEFYNIVYDDFGNSWSFDFSAKFLNGKLQGKIKKVKVEIFETAKQIEKRNKDFELLVEKDKKKFSSKLRNFMNNLTCSQWSRFWRFFAKNIRKLGNKLIHLDIWVIRYIS
jgi:hypothetical protein